MLLDNDRTGADDRFGRAFAAAVSNDRLELVILPTEKCNLRCVYCYEDFALGRMSPEVVGAIKRLIDLRAPELSGITINWFGGEPLLASDIMLSIGRHVQALREAKPELCYQAGATTNGVFLRAPLLHDLVAAGITEYQVSIDGPREHHDRTRLRSDGSGTFDEIWGNLCAIRESDAPVRIMIRLHVHPGNLASLPEFVGRVKDRFLGDERFLLLFMPIAHLGGPNDESFEILERTETRRILRQLSGLARDEPHHIVVASTERAPFFSGDDVCYASKPNAWVIRSNGALAKCTVALNDPRNHVGWLREDGTLDVARESAGAWFQGWRDGEWSGVACPKDAYFSAEEAGPTTTEAALTVGGRAVPV